MRARRAARVALLAVLLAGCGGDREPRATPPSDTGTATSAPSAPSAPATDTSTEPEITTTVPTGSVPGPPGAPTTKKPSEPDAGDEEAIRVPASFRIRRGRITPPRVAVPAFLSIELVIANGDSASHRVSFRGRTLTVAGGDTRSTVFEGLRKGTYPVVVAGGGRAAVVTGAEGGP